MTIPIELVCPLGATCEKVVSNKIERCAWYTQVTGQHPQTGQPVDEWGCAMAWQPILMIENARTNQGQTAAIESLRNEMKAGQDQFNGLMRKRLASETKEVPPCNTV